MLTSLAGALFKTGAYAEAGTLKGLGHEAVLAQYFILDDKGARI